MPDTRTCAGKENSYDGERNIHNIGERCFLMCFACYICMYNKRCWWLIYHAKLAFVLMSFINNTQEFAIDLSPSLSLINPCNCCILQEKVWKNYFTLYLVWKLWLLKSCWSYSFVCIEIFLFCMLWCCMLAVRKSTSNGGRIPWSRETFSFFFQHVLGLCAIPIMNLQSSRGNLFLSLTICAHASYPQWLYW